MKAKRDKYPWEVQEEEAKKLAAEWKGKFDQSFEGYQLLKAEFLKRWDQGVPVRMHGGSGALAYLIAEGLNDLTARGVQKPASATTLRHLVESGAKVRLTDQSVPCMEWLRLGIVRNGWQELALLANFGWNRESGSVPERRFARVLQAWAEDKVISEKVTENILRALEQHAYDRPVTELLTLKREETGFYGNEDFPITPPMNYREEDAKTIVARLDRLNTIKFKWAENGTSEFYKVRVCDWNAKLTDTQSGRLKAYCGGTEYFSKEDPRGGVDPQAMAEAADAFTGT